MFRQFFRILWNLRKYQFLSSVPIYDVCIIYTFKVRTAGRTDDQGKWWFQKFSKTLSFSPMYKRIEYVCVINSLEPDVKNQKKKKFERFELKCWNILNDISIKIAYRSFLIRTRRWRSIVIVIDRDNKWNACKHSTDLF